ncbi:M23 family metallopeptidase [Candidatus Bipolaricaulota bacterium]
MSEGVEVRCIPEDVVYVGRTEWWDLMGQRTTYDGVIHTTALLNRTDSALIATGVRLEALSGEQGLAMCALSEANLAEILPPVIGRDQMGLRKLLDLILWLDNAVGDMPLAHDLTVAPGEAFVIPNLYLAAPSMPEAFRVSVDYRREGGGVETSTARIEASQYTPANDYEVPVTGRWFMKAVPRVGLLDHHRFGVATEFGVDFLRLGHEGAIYAGKGDQETDYFSLGEGVFAAAEGTVVAVREDVPQVRERFFPRAGESEEQFQQRQIKEVHEGLAGDISAWAAGNYILIEHEGGEISAYLHLQPRSAVVREGKEVAQGDPIASVGNTGDSFGAHLHFHVMDHPDLLTGRPLPFRFSNLEAELEEPGMIVCAGESA